MANLTFPSRSFKTDGVPKMRDLKIKKDKNGYRVKQIPTATYSL